MLLPLVLASIYLHFKDCILKLYFLGQNSTCQVESYQTSRGKSYLFLPCKVHSNSTLMQEFGIFIDCLTKTAFLHLETVSETA